MDILHAGLKISTEANVIIQVKIPTPSPLACHWICSQCPEAVVHQDGGGSAVSLISDKSFITGTVYNLRLKAIVKKKKNRYTFSMNPT